jgi:transcription elongation factor Elf1
MLNLNRFIFLIIILHRKMGRKRKRIVRVTRRQLPKVFSCPQCGMISIRIIVKANESSKIVCGNCGVNWEKSNVSKYTEAIDIYNEFVDKYMSGG